MKKTLLYVAAGLFVLSTASCTDEVIIQEHDGLRVSGGMVTESRTTFVQDGEWTHTHWEINDGIGLYTADQSNITYKAVSKGSYSEFVEGGSTGITPEEGKKVKAYYPYSAKASGTEIPLPYTIALSSAKPAAAFMYSEATINKNDLSFKFKHVYSYLKVTISAQTYKESLPTGCTLEGGGFYILSDNAISVSNATFNINTQKISHINTDNKRLFYYFDDMEINGNQTYTYMIPILPQPGNTPVSVYMFYPQTENEGYVSLLRVISKNTPAEGFLAGNVYELDTTGGEAANISQEQALKDLYEATNGAEWIDNTNWLSSKPVSEWYGINNDNSEYNHVFTLELGYNNLIGTLPESLSAIMNKAVWIDLSQNGISGTIPDAVKEHYKWNSLGWLIVPQDPRKGGGLDLTESNLYMPYSKTTDLMTGKAADLQSIFSQNKLTQVVCYNNPSTATDVMTHFTASRVNKHLDYQSKGFGTVIFTETDAEANNSALVASLKEKYGNIKGMHWMNGLPEANVYYIMTYVFDSNGQLVHIAPYSTMQDNTQVDKAYDEFLRSVLGEPATHDPFSFEFYTSTDYSKDGEVFTIQQATEGNGIDIVFIGEGFVDKDMATGGLYETKMKEAADKLFELEPYKSFRNRFNLYGVKVVSPTAEFTEGAKKRLNEDDKVSFELASKYKANLPEDARMMVIAVYNSNSSVGRSYCMMYGDGDFVTYVMSGVNNTLIHEACGHGIAKLADEYVEGGYENVTLPEDEINSLDEYYSMEWGWFANVDYHSTKSTVRWSRFLNDTRYANDGLGIFEGAYTYGKGAYRPSENSMMHSNISWFNAPSREAIYKAIMTLSEGKSWTYNYEDFVEYDKKNLSTSSSTARSAVKKQTRKELQEFRENHRKPVFRKGSWRDAVSRQGNSITVPLK